MARILVPPKLAGETRTDVVDFSPWLAVGQSITGAAVSVSVYSGVDSTPSVVFSSVSVATPLVSVVVTGGVLGVIYAVTVSATTAGPTGLLQATYYLAIIPDVP